MGAELVWRGQDVLEEFSRSQYQASRKATAAVQGTSMDKVNRMEGVKDVPTHLDNNPSKLGDIKPGMRGSSTMS